MMVRSFLRGSHHLSSTNRAKADSAAGHSDHLAVLIRLFHSPKDVQSVVYTTAKAAANRATAYFGCVTRPQAATRPWAAETPRRARPASSRPVQGRRPRDCRE